MMIEIDLNKLIKAEVNPYVHCYFDYLGMYYLFLDDGLGAYHKLFKNKDKTQIYYYLKIKDYLL